MPSLALFLVGRSQLTSTLRHAIKHPRFTISALLKAIPAGQWKSTGVSRLLLRSIKFVGAVPVAGAFHILFRSALCGARGNVTSTRTRGAHQTAIGVDAQLTWADIWMLIRPHLHFLILAMAGALIVALLNVQIPILLGDMVNAIADMLKLCGVSSQNTIHAGISRLNSIALQLAALYSGQALFTFVYISCLSWMGERMASELRVRLFDHLLHFDMTFFDQQRVGELNDRLNSDVQEFKSSFKTTVSQGLRTFTQTGGCIASLYMISPKMTLLTATIVPLVIGLGTSFGILLRRVSNSAQQQGAHAAGVADEAFQNIRTVKAFASEEAETELYRREVETGRRLNERLGAGIGAFQAASNLFLNGIVLCILYAGSRAMFPMDSGNVASAMKGGTGGDQMSPGDLMSFLVTAQTIQRSLGQLSLVFGTALKGWTAGARVHEFLRLQPTNTFGNVQIPYHSLRGNLQLHDVCFTYPSRSGHPVLTHLDLDIKAGCQVALCGRSGSGKSTIAALVQRLYLPQHGRITLDGVDLNAVDPYWLRGKVIGVIAQEPCLFASSIEENIRYGRSDATDEEVREAALMANAHEFIERFPNGYKTVIGERGVTLSGGQKQRIAIARALLKNPPILILDEATSALDTESERAVHDALERVMQGRTVIVIAHRLSTIQNADVICVVEEGRLVEKGTHHELLHHRGAYCNLINLQRQAMDRDSDKID